MDEDVKPEISATPEPKDPKTYKTLLCQYYLKGPCKFADNCQYAHGTSELRTHFGTSVADVEDMAQKKTDMLYKTTLCVKFVSYGSCPFGIKCHFAHGVKDLRTAAEEASTSAMANLSVDEKVKINPAYKTSLCTNYMVGKYCQFADKCQYAHGKHELRDKPKIPPPSEITEELKQKLTQKAKTMPGYKTKMCKNFQTVGSCDYNEMCHYAHGEAELREETEAEKDLAEKLKVKKNPFYKTVMCQKLSEGECPYGENCVYAHSEAEIRTVTTNTPAYKTSLCKSFMNTGQCNFGAKCNFAHGQHELRPHQALPGQHQHPHHQLQQQQQQQQQQHYFIHDKDGKKRFRTSMCSTYMEKGFCARGNACAYAHSVEQMLAAQANDPKYKSMLCDNWKTKGSCERGKGCAFAHGTGELRPYGGQPQQIPSTSFSSLTPVPAAPAPHHMMGTPAGSTPMTASTVQTIITQRPLYKTSLCIAFNTKGHCTKGEACMYAHGPGELRAPPPGSASVSSSSATMNMNVVNNHYPNHLPHPHHHQQQQPHHQHQNHKPNFKTVLCKTFTEAGFCTYGATCNFAHGYSELRTYGDGNEAAVGGHGAVAAHGSNSGGMGIGMAMDAQIRENKRKRSNVKTALCTNFTSTGYCKYGDNCTFAHGQDDLAINKKQRI